MGSCLSAHANVVQPTSTRSLRPSWPTPFDEDEDEPADDGKDPAAVALGRKGGLKSGRARADKLTAEQRSEIARKAAAARWGEQSNQS